MASAPQALLIESSAELADAQRIFIAYSGGLDSTVLLHAAAAQLPSRDVRAVHINHQLSPNSDQWQRHCQAVCTLLGVPLVAFTVAVNDAGDGLEQAARRARYQCFGQLLRVGDVLLLAHHLDDQAETLLFRLLRGSGPKGLAGMPASRPLGAGRLLRPLLNFTRQQLENYAKAHGLAWVEDESNASQRFDRNYLRHRLLPLVAERWPDYRARLLRTAEQCRNGDLVLQECAQQDLKAVDVRPERVGTSLCLRHFRALSEARQKNLLRFWIESMALPIPGHKPIAALLSDVIPAKVDATPSVVWAGGEIRRFQQRLYLLPPMPEVAPSGLVPAAALDSEIQLPDGGSLGLRVATGEGVRWQVGDNAEIRFRQGGERCRPTGRQHSTSLKKLLQEYRLEPWLRDRVPLLYINGSLAAVGDLFVCADFAATCEDVGVVLRWCYGFAGQGGDCSVLCD